MEEPIFDIAGYINERLQQTMQTTSKRDNPDKFRLPRKKKKKMKKAYSSRYGVPVKQLRFIDTQKRYKRMFADFQEFLSQNENE